MIAGVLKTQQTREMSRSASKMKIKKKNIFQTLERIFGFNNTRESHRRNVTEREQSTKECGINENGGISLSFFLEKKINAVVSSFSLKLHVLLMQFLVARQR